MTTGKVEMLQTESQLTLGGSPAALLSPLLISLALGIISLRLLGKPFGKSRSPESTSQKAKISLSFWGKRLHDVSANIFENYLDFFLLNLFCCY